MPMCTMAVAIAFCMIAPVTSFGMPPMYSSRAAFVAASSGAGAGARPGAPIGRGAGGGSAGAGTGAALRGRPGCPRP